MARQLDETQQLLDARPARRAPGAVVEGQRPPDDLAHGLLGVHGSVGHLVDHLKAALLVLGTPLERRGQRLAAEDHLARRGRQEPRDDPRRRGLARSGLADHGHRPSLRHGDRHVMQDGGVAIGRRHAAHFQLRLGGRAFGLVDRAHRPEASGVLLARRLQHGPRLGLLHLAAVAQHLDAVRHLGDHREVVRDVDRGRVEALHRVLHRAQHPHLRRHVERRGGLVEDDQVGPRRHGHGRHHALELPARDLMGIAQTDLARVGKPQRLVEAHRVLARLAGLHHVVPQRALDRLVDQAVRRVEGCRRRLGHVGHARAPEPALLGLWHRPEIHPVEGDAPAYDPAARPREAHRGEAQGRFASPALADQAQHLAAPEREVHAVDDLLPGLARAALDPHVLHLQEHAHSLSPDERCRSQSTTKFTETVRSAMAPAGMKGVRPMRRS